MGGGGWTSNTPVLVERREGAGYRSPISIIFNIIISLWIGEGELWGMERKH